MKSEVKDKMTQSKEFFSQMTKSELVELVSQLAAEISSLEFELEVTGSVNATITSEISDLEAELTLALESNDELSFQLARFKARRGK